ncbi:cell division ATP-binding protein FtsE [Nesterenkonia natronophila]|uniref:Cell division ATP-binding protein FtsE n=1 Tax=Nesterenkonia natronophila TaxID=2174932 RepID=A0A3A4F571_9MICC|nr:cell division ATP-binding protein FtsE [Nesterenkonia natronophila]RJN33048.1 cell division ATP-binding protein FtsE [Nesterenkonia natronophila]
MIRFEHVTRTYRSGGRPALDDVSVEFNRGDFVFLIGASGSGKSTLLRMILREGLPQKGKVTVAGQNLVLMLERRVPHYRRSIGMVFQDFRLLPDKTVYENVAFAMRVIGAPRGHIKKQVIKTLERVQLDHLARRYPHEISGGEQQRAAIARAIVNEPAIVLADEPTGNLDPRASEEVMKILRWINTSGTTVVMATHDRAIVDQTQRRVVQLHKGKLVRDEARGFYDPPEGSPAWDILSDELEQSALQASDPMPMLAQSLPVGPEEPGRDPEDDSDADEPPGFRVREYQVTFPEDDPQHDDAETEEPAAEVDVAALPEFDDDEDTSSLAPRDQPGALPSPADTPSDEPSMPRPRASTAEATYADTQHTADQLRASKPRGVFGRRKR